MRILLVEDDDRIAMDVSKALHEAGYVVEHAADGQGRMVSRRDRELRRDRARSRLAGARWIDGAEAVAGARVVKPRFSSSRRGDPGVKGSKGSTRAPTIICPSLSNSRNCLRAYDRSSGDRRAESSSVLKVGRVTLDERNMTFKVDDASIDLTTLEYRLLAYLMHRHGQVVPQSELVEHVYGQDHQTSNAVEVLVARVRKKIGAGFIETRRGFGYLVPDTPK